VGIFCNTAVAALKQEMAAIILLLVQWSFYWPGIGIRIYLFLRRTLLRSKIYSAWAKLKA